MNFEIEDIEGKSTVLGKVGLVKAPDQPEPGVFELLFQANLKNLETGFYQLKLSFKDVLANQKIVTKTPFILQ